MRAQRMLALVQRLLTARPLPVAVAALAVALSLPSLWLGLQLDDHVLRAALTDPPPVSGWSKGPVDVFAFFTGDPAQTRQYIDAGFLPWWTSADYRVAFFRPLAGLTHWIDFRLWPDRVGVMHLHSLIWFGAVVAGAAVFFRRLIGASWAAGLAALLFAVDEAHGLPAVWLANRNACIAAAFGILALLAHDRWRRTGSRWSLALSLVALLRRDRVARFFGLGMVLALLPACGTFPSGRLLVFVGLGGSGLLALFLAALVDRAPWIPRARAWRGLAAAAFGIFVAIHMGLAPVGLSQAASNVRALGDTVHAVAETLPADAAIGSQRAVIVNTPNFFLSVLAPLLQLEHGRPIPPRTLVLTSRFQALRVTRPADNVLAIRPQGGLLAPPGTSRSGNEAPRSFDLRYFYEAIDGLYRDAAPFRAGERLALSGLVIEVTAITSDGRPAAVAYRFETSLDDASRRWLQWRDGAYAPFPMPGVGDTIDLPSASAPAGPWGRQRLRGAPR